MEQGSINECNRYFFHISCLPSNSSKSSNSERFVASYAINFFLSKFKKIQFFGNY